MTPYGARRADGLLAVALLAIGVSTPVYSQTPAQGATLASPRTASVSGRILAADTGRPLRRTQITLTAPELGQERRTANTGLDGRYEFKDLPPGRYVIRAQRSGYLTLQYGQRRPLELARPLQLGNGQTFADADFRLPRMGAIGGMVFDDAGEPIAGVDVWAMRPAYVEGRRQLVIVGQTSTDDTGEYRLPSLVPGRYYVRAATRETWTVSGAGRRELMGFAATFAPTAPAADKARLIEVGVGQRVRDVDVSLIPMRPANLSGFAFGSNGQPLAGRQVDLGIRFLREFPGGGGMSLGRATIGADGSFLFKNVTAGDYEVSIFTGEMGTPGAEMARMQVTINGVDLEGVRLAASAGWTVTGRIVTEEGLTPALPRGSVSVRGVTLLQMAVRGVGAATLTDDFNFTVKSLVGPARLAVTVPDGWMVKAIRQKDRDLMSEYVDLKSGETLADVEVIVTNRVTRVTGQLVDDRGAPLANGTILVFPADASKWGEASSHVRAERPDQQGRYEISGLPAGEYLAIALDYLQDGLSNDPDYLESLRRLAQPFPLGDGTARPLSLKVVQP